EATLETISATAASQFVVLCAADDDYFAQGIDLISQVRRQVPDAKVMIAGKPAGIESLSADYYLHARMSVLAFLEEVSQPYIS
ncbi:MAG: hypothetical protein AAFP02_18115, partial [Bacteroidota bacterium]